MKFWIFLILLGTGQFFFAQASRAEPPHPSVAIQDEINRLERLRWAGHLTPKNRIRLAEIYFMISRCDDVRTLLIKPKDKRSADKFLLCACGGGCNGRSDVERASKFKKLLDNATAWRDPRVQHLWRKVREVPEARYWALKSFRRHPQELANPKLRAMSVALEKSLESMEIK